MQIDWLTVGAQIVNFLVLVALLRRFLYRPVLEVMARREADIARRLEEAGDRTREADARMRDCAARAEAFDRDRQTLIDAARDEAETAKRQLLHEAREDAREAREQWRRQLDREWADLRQALRRRLASAVAGAARRALADLADEDLDRAIVRVFCHRVEALPDDALAELGGPGGPITVVTAFEPDEDVRRRIADTVTARLGRPAEFGRAADLVAGIELRTDGWKLGWTIDGYLQDLEADLSAALDARPPDTARDR